MNNYIVYMHKCKNNGKVYIGMTNNLQRRWRCQGIEYKPHRGKTYTWAFWNALQKYGWDGFEHLILEENLSESECQERERYYIAFYKSRERDFGYNIAEGGNGGRVYVEHPKGMSGKHHTEQKKAAQRELMTRLNAEGKCGATWKNGHPKGMKGKHHSEEFKQRLRDIPSDQHPSARKVVVEYPDGCQKVFGCLKYLSMETGVDNSTLIKIIKSNCPYQLKPQCHTNRENLSKIDGAKIYYLENTEAIN